MRAWPILVALLLTATSALAHHSNSAFDPEKVVVLKGTVMQWLWTNPHVWIHPGGRRWQWRQDGVADRGPPAWRAGSFRLVEDDLQAR